MSGIVHNLLGAGSGPIVYVGGYTFNDSGSSKTSSTVSYDSNLTGGISSSVKAGDLVVVATAFNDSPDIGISNSTGFTELADLYANDTYDPNLGVYAKVMTSSPDTSITLTYSSGVFPISAVMVFRKVNTATPVGSVVTSTQTNTGQPNPPSSPITNNDIYLCVGAGSGSSAPGTEQNDFTSSDMDTFITLHTDFCALGMGFSTSDSDAAQFGGGTTSTTSGTVSAAFNIKRR